MLIARVTLAILALRALSTLASPSGQVTDQDPDHQFQAASDSVRGDTESAGNPSSNPEVRLDDGLFVGFQKGKTDNFLGIPFALPPTGDRRLRQPEPVEPYVGTHYVQEYGESCPQQALTLPNPPDAELIKAIGKVVNEVYEVVTPADEDCLTLNVVKPSSATPDSGLPVLVWIFGGGFEIGGTSTPIYDGANIVGRSLDLKQPVIFVSMNYRLSALGFLPGKEVKEQKVGNLGLQDQRLALRWIQTYISKFGGDPSKVTIWGESAGAISVNMHMLTNNGDQEGLFRGAIMQSGGPISVGPIENGQQYYDHMVRETGCRGQPDTLDCLRRVPYATFKRAMDSSPNLFSYQGLVLAWMPRVDGVFLTEPPEYSVLRGHVSNVPLITGNCDDEGTLFSVSTTNISTTAQLKQYLKLFMLPRATDEEIDTLLVYYPDDQRAGSPFDTGFLNVLSPQFKRTAALQGDFIFHGPRRFFLKNRANKQNSWGFVFKRLKGTPFLGAFHASDLLNSFLGGELEDYILRFANYLDPNGGQGRGIFWPQWNPDEPKALIFKDDLLFPVITGDDTYRSQPLDYVANLSLRYPF
ncbi:carotenoid ester lipase precursor [Russula dissimulans]|nr:carotenoid ester lipase precursor [Russula dissimulans]